MPLSSPWKTRSSPPSLHHRKPSTFSLRTRSRARLSLLILVAILTVCTLNELRCLHYRCVSRVRFYGGGGSSGSDSSSSRDRGSKGGGAVLPPAESWKYRLGEQLKMNMGMDMNVMDAGMGMVPVGDGGKGEEKGKEEKAKEEKAKEEKAKEEKEKEEKSKEEKTKEEKAKEEKSKEEKGKEGKGKEQKGKGAKEEHKNGELVESTSIEDTLNGLIAEASGGRWIDKPPGPLSPAPELKEQMMVDKKMYVDGEGTESPPRKEIAKPEEASAKLSTSPKAEVQAGAQERPGNNTTSTLPSAKNGNITQDGVTAAAEGEYESESEKTNGTTAAQASPLSSKADLESSPLKPASSSPATKLPPKVLPKQHNSSTSTSPKYSDRQIHQLDDTNSFGSMDMGLVMGGA